MSDIHKSKSDEADTAIEIDETGKASKKPEEKKPVKPIKINGGARWKRFVNWYKSNKKKSIPLTAVLLLVLLAVIPWSRYQLAALVLKNDYNLAVVDSTAGTAISGAKVSVGNVQGLTDGSGRVKLRKVNVGHHKILITKKYYKDKSMDVLVPILKQKGSADFKLSATGRQVKISVKNLINHTTLADVDIKIAEVSSRTDKSGNAIIVLPVGTKSAKATLSLDGYNNASVNVLVDDKIIKENNFALTPAGKVYFLSKLSGKIDVVKTNLDGSGRQTVLAGTGKEDSAGTVLLASRDWKYLALLSKREGASNPKLYLINTSDDTMISMDNETDSSFSPVGWSEHNFIYTVSRDKLANWQPNHQAIKGFDAESKKNMTLDQTRAEGSGDYDYANEYYGAVYQVGKTVVYNKYWNAYYASPDKLTSKQAAIYSITATGSNAQTLKTFGYESGKYKYINSIPYESGEIYYQIDDNGTQTYYEYNNGKISAKSDIADEFNKYYQQGAVTYLQSPSGDETFWSESRDGKYSLFIGDGSGSNSKQVATLSEYQTYGWYSGDYLLVSKNGSELYVMAKTGPSRENQPVKITDYHKPARSFLGYGGGYGGI